MSVEIVAVRISYLSFFACIIFTKEEGDIMGVEVVTVSSKGQIVLPMEMRKSLSIADGDTMAAFATDKVIILRPCRLPTAEEFSEWLEEAEMWAKEAGYGEDDITGIIQSVRRKQQ